MNKRAAHELADKVRRQLTGIDGVIAVDGIHYNPHAGDDQGWAVRVARRPRDGGDVTVIGSERGGYTTTDRTGSNMSLPALVREVFLLPPTGSPEPSPDGVRPDDDHAAAVLRQACATLREVRDTIGEVATELATRKEQLPWVIVTIRRGVEEGPGLKVYGPYDTAPLANRALEEVPEAAMAVESPTVSVSVTQLQVPGVE